MVPVFIMFPAGFNLYAVSNIAGFAVQSKLMRNDKFRKAVGLKPSAYLQSIQSQTAQNSPWAQTGKNFGKKKQETMKVTVGSKAPKVKSVPLRDSSDKTTDTLHKGTRK